MDTSVSYTHLDVYKRQVDDAARWMGQRAGEIGNALDKLMGAFRLDGNADRA